MSKAILEFDLNDIDDKEAHFIALQGGVYLTALKELASKFRKHRKYDGPEVTEETFYEVLTDLGIEL
jgi:hypothetical protein